MRQRSVQLNIRLTEAEMEMLKRDAAAKGHTKSEYVRRRLCFLQPVSDGGKTDDQNLASNASGAPPGSRYSFQGLCAPETPQRKEV
jgi:hypothetical protein